jgi:hypothetical protein
MSHVWLGIALVLVVIIALPVLAHTKFGGYWSKLYVSKNIELDAQATSLGRVTDLSIGVFLGIVFSETDFHSRFTEEMTLAEVFTKAFYIFMLLLWCVVSWWLQRLPSAIMEANKTYKTELWVFVTKSLLFFIIDRLLSLFLLVPFCS